MNEAIKFNEIMKKNIQHPFAKYDAYKDSAVEMVGRNTKTLGDWQAGYFAYISFNKKSTGLLRGWKFQNL